MLILFQDLVHKNNLGPYLSSNKLHVRKAEGDAEALHMAVMKYKGFLDIGDIEKANDYIHSLKKKHDRTPLPRIMRCPEIRNTLLRLFGFKSLFHMSHVVTKRWISNNLLAVAGGASCSIFLALFMQPHIYSAHYFLYQLLDRLLAGSFHDRSSSWDRRF
jgi:hypothetical protein